MKWGKRKKVHRKCLGVLQRTHIHCIQPGGGPELFAGSERPYKVDTPSCDGVSRRGGAYGLGGASGRQNSSYRTAQLLVSQKEVIGKQISHATASVAEDGSGSCAGHWGVPGEIPVTSEKNAGRHVGGGKVPMVRQTVCATEAIRGAKQLDPKLAGRSKSESMF